MSTKQVSYDHIDFPGSPWEQGRTREVALAQGLMRLAEKYEVEFEAPLHINSNGEFRLVLAGGARFGDELAGILSKYRPRCGVHPTNHLDGMNGWCYMNHFNVQQMLEENGI